MSIEGLDSAKLISELLRICAHLDASPDAPRDRDLQARVCRALAADPRAQAALLALPNLANLVSSAQYERLIYSAPSAEFSTHWSRMSAPLRMKLLCMWDLADGYPPSMTAEHMAIDADAARKCALRLARDPCRVRAIFMQCSPFWLNSATDDSEFNARIRPRAGDDSCVIRDRAMRRAFKMLLADMRKRHAREVMRVLLRGAIPRKYSHGSDVAGRFIDTSDSFVSPASLLIDIPHLSCYIAHLIMSSRRSRAGPP